MKPQRQVLLLFFIVASASSILALAWVTHSTPTTPTPAPVITYKTIFAGCTWTSGQSNGYGGADDFYSCSLNYYTCTNNNCILSSSKTYTNQLCNDPADTATYDPCFNPSNPPP